MGRREKSSSLWDALGILFLFDLFSSKKTRRKNNEASLGDILWILFGLFAIFYCVIYIFVKMIKWTIKGLVWIFTAIGNTISNASNNSTSSSYSNDNYQNRTINTNTTIYKNNRKALLPKPLTNNNVNYKENIKYKTQTIKLPKYNIKTPYDALFSDLIMMRGIDYYNSKKVTNYKLDGQTCTADINGTEKYKTQIVFYKNGKIKKAECTCLYFKKDSVYCKHIYALLLNYCNEEKINGFINEKYYEEKNKQVPVFLTKNGYSKMISICEAMEEIISNTEDYYNGLYDTTEIEYIYDQILEYEDKIKEYQNTKMADVNQLLINKAQNDLDDMRSLYDELEIEIDEIEEDDEEESNGNYEFNEALAVGFVAHEIHKDYLKRKEVEEYEAEREELRNTWGLLDHEIDEVQKGNYDPWQFEENGDLEEDDYYYEDEK